MNEKILILVGHKNGKTSLTKFFIEEFDSGETMGLNGIGSRWFESSISDMQPKFLIGEDLSKKDWEKLGDLIKDVIHGDERTIDVKYAPQRKEVIDTKFIIHVQDENQIPESIKRYALIYHLSF